MHYNVSLIFTIFLVLLRLFKINTIIQALDPILKSFEVSILDCFHHYLELLPELWVTWSNDICFNISMFALFSWTNAILCLFHLFKDFNLLFPTFSLICFKHSNLLSVVVRCNVSFLSGCILLKELVTFFDLLMRFF